MGGSGSTRWKNHQKAPVIEDCHQLNVASLEPALQHDQIDGELPLTDSQTGEANGQFSFSLGPVSVAGSRRLLIDPGNNRRRQSIRLERAQRGWYRGWLFCCPSGCGRRAKKLYALPKWMVFTCRKCAGLTYASAQQHDSRRDLARRDPVGFIQSRSRAPQTANSQWVTARLAYDAQISGRPGRGWARHAVTSGSRAIDQMHQEFRDKWGFGLADVARVARGG